MGRLSRGIGTASIDLWFSRHNRLVIFASQQDETEVLLGYKRNLL